MIIRKSISLSDVELKYDGGDAGTFIGYASRWGGIDTYGDTILKGAFETTLKRDGKPKMFYSHDSFGGLPIGKWISAKEDDKGLLMEGELTPGLSLSNDVRAALKHGTMDGLSIGGYLKAGDYEGRPDGGRIIKKWSRLIEVSIVAFPADSAARIDLGSVKSAELEESICELETIRDFERFLRDAGGLSKGLAEALVSRAKLIFVQGEPEPKPADAKAMQELQVMLQRMQARIPL